MVQYLPPRDMSYQCSEDVPQRRPEDVLNDQEIRISVFAFSINKCFITKMASTTQQVEHRKRRNMKYVSSVKQEEAIKLQNSSSVSLY